MFGIKNRKTALFLVLLFTTCLVLIGIGGCAPVQKAQEVAPMPLDVDESVSPAEIAKSISFAVRGAEDGIPLSENEGAFAGRYIIRNAQLTLEVADLEEAVEEMRSRVKEVGGYVAQLEIFHISQDRQAGHLVLRVPDDKFDYFFVQLKALGKAKNERIFTDDVTRQYIDLEARIENMEAQEKRMRDLLEKAETIEEILQVERELGRIRGELESMQRDFKHLREMVRFSTITVYLEEKDPRTQVVTDGFTSSWEKLGYLLILNTNRLIHGLSGAFVYFVGSLPIVLPLAAAGYGFTRLALAVKRKKLERGKTDEKAGE